MTQTLSAPAVLSACKLDRRTARTRAALRKALAEEIDVTGDLTSVTVTGVTERAGLTRRTFYSHYKDIPDLVLHIEKEALAELRPAVEQLARVNLVELKEAIDSYKPCPGATEMLRSIRKHGFYLRPLLGNGGDPAFQDKLKHLVHEVIAQRALHIGSSCSVFKGLYRSLKRQLYQYITYPFPCQHFFEIFLSFFQFYFLTPSISLINQ